MIEVGHKGIGHTEIVRREDELISPALELLQQSVGTHGTLCGTGCTDTYGTHTVTSLLRAVHDVTGLLVDEHLF